MGRVDILHREIDEPVARHRRWSLRVHLRGAGDALTVDLELRVRLIRRARRAGRPAEYSLVERQDLVDAARVHLGPGEAVRRLRPKAAHPGGLPAGDECPRRILEDGHPALVADIERRRGDGPAGCLDLGAQRLGVVGADVEHPRGRLVGRLCAADPGDILAVAAGEGVATVLRVLIDFDVPPEDRRVEASCRSRIRRRKIDPRWLVDHGRRDLCHDHVLRNVESARRAPGAGGMTALSHRGSDRPESGDASGHASAGTAAGTPAVARDRVASNDPIVTSPKPITIGTVSVSFRTRTPRIAATAGLTYAITVARTGPISSINAANRMNAAAEQTTPSTTSEMRTFGLSTAVGHCVTAMGA